ncbi:MAG TPA: hypothetical protein VGH98_16680 [Gemmatimonadaceae bacterium]|jgi:hypothetical protein
MKTLEEVLRDHHAEAAMLRRNGYVAEADARERMLREIENASGEYREFLSEGEASLRSGKSVAWFRSRFDAWTERGLARYNPKTTRKERQYRSMIVPMRANVVAVRDDARQAAPETIRSQCAE